MPVGKLDWPRFGGVVAQLVERLNGIQEVRGSTPLGSTTANPETRSGLWRSLRVDRGPGSRSVSPIFCPVSPIFFPCSARVGRGIEDAD